MTHFNQMMAGLNDAEAFLQCGISATALLLHRTIMNRIFEGGSIWYDKDRFDAYCIVARISSDMRHDLLKRHA